ncbi:MAG: tetratricopeptide repeat protein [Anaerolineae bacterium]|nr:tetratricopeptide repeat protein [Anaerolineae bacterium]
MSNEPNWLAFFEDRERLWADYYLDFAEQNARRDAEAYERLEAESGNLLKIVAWLSEQNRTEGILQLAEVLWQKSDFMRSRGFMQRGLPLLEQARAAACRIGDSEAEIIWLEALANVHWSINNFALAQPLYEQVMELAQQSNKPRLKAQAQLGMGRLQMDLGHLEDAAILLKLALQEYRQIQDYEGEIITLTFLGNLLSLQGCFAEAEAYLEQGILLAQTRQNRQSEAALRYALGYNTGVAQDWQKAATHFKAATDMARSVGDRFLEVRGLHNQGEAWLELGDVHQAVTLLEEAVIAQESLDDILTKSFTHFYLAKAYNILNAPAKSLDQLRVIFPYLLERRDAPVLATMATEAAWIMADNHLKQGRADLAQSALQDVLLLAPDHMSHICYDAERLLNSITHERVVEDELI